MLENRRRYMIENNSLLSFVNDCCIRYLNRDNVKRSNFNKVYKAWCLANRVQPERDREIGKQLKKHFEIEAKKSRGYYYYPMEIKAEVINEFEIDM